MTDFDMLACFEDMEANTDKGRSSILRAPYAWPGGKQRSLDKILPMLPYTDRYVEVCGGGGSILLNRRPSKFEVFNDRNAGITAFYRCLRSPVKFKLLCEWLELTVHSREEWLWARNTWENCEDDVERAGRWYYMLTYSFGHLGRNFGRSKGPGCILSGRIHERLVHFQEIHERFRSVQVENLDWYDCMVEYDHHDAVFYVDPDYLGTSKGIYKHSWTVEMHQELLNLIFNKIKGFVAVSGIPNTLYDSYPWDNKISWSAFRSIKSTNNNEDNNKAGIDDTSREPDIEVLFVKEPTLLLS